jgi:tRNA dimethylallyltransferase
LKRIDPKAAHAIHPNDSAKVIRAIEVSFSMRQPITEAWKQGREPLTGYRILRLGLNPERSKLYERINHRAASMFESGLIEETRTLLAKYGDERGVPPLKSLGYLQAVQILRGQLSEAAAVAEAQQRHRNYAKRQLTWFRREPNVEWFEQFGDSPIAAELARKSVLHFLAG